jgi:Chaperone of endosialidase
VSALANNGSGRYNVAAGWNALYFNKGNDNTAIGSFALQDNGSGGNNIALGVEAGFYLTTGSNNIEIGNPGNAGEGNTIRIGVEGTQAATYIAGIFNATVTGGCQVVVASTGQLGCVTSSARYKRDVRDMADSSDKLMQLRPVSFLYKADETGARQYGLIAEEVEKVYPELVVHDADGKAETVAYHLLPPMLLNEVQKLARQLDQKDEQIAALERQVVEIEALVKALR